MNELSKVKNYIEQFHMIEKEESVIVGVSGGADSVCLYKMLLTLKTYFGCDIMVVHIHHGIRGEEADRDMNFVKEMCERDNVQFECYRYNVPEYSKEKGLSEEEAGRILRYETFKKVADTLSDKDKKVKIAVAHNRNDNAETFIHNLCRGSGLKGLTGISCAMGLVIRPVLCLARDEIEEYLTEKHIEYINDSTNMSEEYTRNKIRHKVLPYLQQHINNKSLLHICQVTEEVKEAETYLSKITDGMYEKTVTEHNNCIYINKNMIKEADRFVARRVIRQAVGNKAGKLKDITRQHIEDVLELSEKQTGRQIMLPYNIKAFSEYENIVLKNTFNDKIIQINATEITKPGTYEIENNVFEVEIIDIEEENINIKIFENHLKSEQKMYTKCFDYDKINFTVQLRYREPGDFLVVNYEGNRKKLKTFFIDEKIPAEERKQIPLFADGPHIMWIVGYRISEEYKITSDTKRILRITGKDKE